MWAPRLKVVLTKLCPVLGTFVHFYTNCFSYPEVFDFSSLDSPSFSHMMGPRNVWFLDKPRVDTAFYS